MLHHLLPIEFLSEFSRFLLGMWNPVLPTHTWLGAGREAC